MAATPILLGVLVAGCSVTEDVSSYVDDLVGYIEGDEETFGEEAAPGADEAYRSLHEVPSEAPDVSSAEERITVAKGLAADREKARHAVEELRARIELDAPMENTAEDARAARPDRDRKKQGQLRAVYEPAAKEAAEPSPQGGA